MSCEWPKLLVVHSWCISINYINVTPVHHISVFTLLHVPNMSSNWQNPFSTVSDNASNFYLMVFLDPSFILVSWNLDENLFYPSPNSALHKSLGDYFCWDLPLAKEYCLLIVLYSLRILNYNIQLITAAIN